MDLYKNLCFSSLLKWQVKTQNYKINRNNSEKNTFVPVRILSIFWGLNIFTIATVFDLIHFIDFVNVATGTHKLHMSF